MMELKSRLARLLRRWAQCLEPVLEVPPIQYTINRVHKIQVAYEDTHPYFPEPSIIEGLDKKLINALYMHGAIKITKVEPGHFGGKRYIASIFAMIAGDKEGGVS